jgi:hypothetical protein
MNLFQLLHLFCICFLNPFAQFEWFYKNHIWLKLNFELDMIMLLQKWVNVLYETKVNLEL